MPQSLKKKTPVERSESVFCRRYSGIPLPSLPPLPSSGSTILVRCPAFAATHEWHDERTPSPTLPDHADVTFRHRRWQIDTQFFNQFFLLNSAFLCFACDHHEWLSVDRGGSRLLSGTPLGMSTKIKITQYLSTNEYQNESILWIISWQIQ